MTLTTRAHAVVLAVVAASLLGGHAQAQVPDRAGSGGTLVWEDVFIEGATPVNDLYILNAVDTEGRRVFAAGSGPYHDGPTISPFVIIRAHDADTGTLLWQTTRVERNEVLAGFGIGDGRVFAAGGGRSGFCRLCFNAFFVRAYDSATGSVLWEERLGQCQNQPGDCPDPVRATDLASDEGRVVVGGCHGSASCFLRAYDGATGILLWERALPTFSVFLGGPRVLAGDERVFAVTGVFDSASSMTTFTLHAYDAALGSLLWESVLPESRSLASAVGPKGVFAAGDSYVRAHDVVTGELLWDVSNPSPRAQLTARGPLLFAVRDSVRAYDATTGTLLWEDQPPSVVFNAVTSQGGQVFAAGSYASGAAYPDQFWFFLVRAYDADTGALLWDNRQPSPTPTTRSDTANAIAATGGRVFAGGILDLYRASTTEEWHLRAYNVQ